MLFVRSHGDPSAAETIGVFLPTSTYLQCKASTPFVSSELRWLAYKVTQCFYQTDPGRPIKRQPLRRQGM